MVNSQNLNQIEENLILDAIYYRHGYDFRNYARASLRRRLNEQMTKDNLIHLSELIPKILYDDNYFYNFLIDISVNVTEMFRDPNFYLAFKNKIFPRLESFAYLKIWHAGCSTGEEVYSMAILLEEADLLKRTNLYATDINPRSLKIASEGIYPISTFDQYQNNYRRSEGKLLLAKYYYAEYGFAKIRSSLKKKILFSEHNLTCDQSFGEMNVIICRNVLIYFNAQLQHTVLKLFYDSLCHRGVLCLGERESLELTGMKEYFEVLDSKEKIFIKRSGLCANLISR